MKPLVSIVVPVYNVEDYLAKCLETLSRQAYEGIEIIIVDDGSTDGSGRICDEFAKNEPRVRVFHKKNGGLSSARNFGIKKAKGEFVCLVDSDDYVKEKFVEEMVKMALTNEVDVVVCGYNDVIPEEGLLSGEEATVRLLVGQENIDIIAWNKMYRLGLFKDIDYPEGSNYEDNLTTYKLLSKAKRVAYAAKSLYCYIERAGSITKKDKKLERLKSRERAAAEAKEYFKDKKELEEAAEIAMLTAKLAFVDFAVSGDVEKKYIDYGVTWIKKYKKRLLKNKYLTKKLKLYIYLVTHLNAKLYIGFRKIRHE
ncbi:MAG: glycosyltransferase [Candidatus Saccharibacteria bacterium]|nr:glycosyltransferase [Candidatus Saccharibacteria bacterium]